MKKIILYGFILTSTVSNAYYKSEDEWKITPRIAVGGSSYGVDVNLKLLRAITDRFNFGFQLGYSKDPDKMIMFGVTPEIKVYRSEILHTYINSSVLWAYTTESERTHYKTADTIYKVGIGARLNSGLGLESGAKYVTYKKINKDHGDHKSKKMHPYIEISYTF